MCAADPVAISYYPVANRGKPTRCYQPVSVAIDPQADVLSIYTRNDSFRASAISAGFAGFASPRIDVDSLRVDIASAADLPRRGGNTRFRAAHILLSHAGHRQEWRDECDGKDVFDSHDFLPHLLESATDRLQALSHRCSSKRRDIAAFLGVGEIVSPAARARAPEPRRLQRKFPIKTAP